MLMMKATKAKKSKILCFRIASTPTLALGATENRRLTAPNTCRSEKTNKLRQLTNMDKTKSKRAKYIRRQPFKAVS